MTRNVTTTIDTLTDSMADHQPYPLMHITSLTQYKQDSRISMEKCVAAHSAAGSWREQRVRDAVEHLPAARPLGVPDLHRHMVAWIGMRESFRRGV